MSRFHFINGLFSFFVVFSVTVKCSRRYDVHEEAKKLYHTDINSILQMFRRTPEYLKILDHKRQSLEDSLRDAKMHLNYVYLKKLEDKVKEMYDLDRNTTKQEGNVTVTPEGNITTAATLPQMFRRQNDPEPEPGVKVLDRYSLKAGSSNLTQEERIRAKNLGFEYTGNIIGAVIKTLGKEIPMPANELTTMPPPDQIVTETETATTNNITTNQGRRSQRQVTRTKST